MRHIGFSTGAVAGGDFPSALALLANQPGIDSIELSALRPHEVEPLLRAIPNMDLNRYSYISFHAPSSFPAEEEAPLVAAPTQFVPKEWPIVLHPDAIHDACLWSALGNRVALENMDRRKSTGRTAGELRSGFGLLPDARFCFDIGHARQCDTSMAESYRILEAYGPRLTQLHVSEVNSASQHDPISYATKLGFQSIAHIPLIIESRVSQSEISKEIDAVLESLPLFAETPGFWLSQLRTGRPLKRSEGGKGRGLVQRNAVRPTHNKLPREAGCSYNKLMIVWDEAKRKMNLEKHGLDFADADLVYENPSKITFQSPRKGEARKQDIAMVAARHKVLTLIYVERGTDVQVISFRVASRVEREVYEQAQEPD